MSYHSKMGKWGGSHEAGCTGRISVRGVRIDSGGYSPSGEYFGRGAPVYEVTSDDCRVDFNLRAGSRECAVAEVREMYPAAKLPRVGACQPYARGVSGACRKRSKKRSRR